MDFELSRGNYNYLKALKNIDIEEVDNYLKKEEMEDIFKTEGYNEIKDKALFSILESVYVLPEDRGDGIGTDMVYEYLRKVKADVYILLADVSNDTDKFSVERFYNQFGFKTIYQDEIFPIMVKTNNR